MRLLTRAITIVFACTVLFAGCDSLNLQPNDELASGQVWNDPALTRAYLNDVYTSTGPGFANGMIIGLTSDGQYPKGSGGQPIWLSNMTPTNLAKWSDNEEPLEKYQWDSVYSNVRDLNIFLRNVEESEGLPSDMRETFLGEAYFLRAFFYFHLMRLHGGVPYITSIFELSSDLDQYQLPRNTFKETVDNIVADLDSANTRLSIEARREGAATKGAALALRCRVRVHAASDLFHDSPFSGSEAAEFVAYTGGSQQDRWQTAASACQDVIDMNEYSLEQTSSAEAYHELFTKGNESGTIWAQYYSESGGEEHNISLWSSPNGWRSWSTHTPTQQHVDAYEMADGSEFEWEGGDPTSAEEPVDAENPYKNRDPRLHANIFYNGRDWRPRPEGVQSIDPKGVVQTGYYEMPDRSDLRPGLDTRQGPIEPWNGTKTGYSFSKFVDRDIDPKNAQAYIPWVSMRYAEILLNKAEAEANLGNTGPALSALNKVRSRVGMPSVTQSDLTADRTLIDRIRRERRIELVMEEFRYFDVRRWMIAPETHEDAKGVRIEGELAPDDGELLSKYRYNYKYKIIRVDQRRWKDKNYFAPIPQDEMNKNNELVQNPGY